ncbi:hypothetical protein BpHYR1_016746 [Brachionus plicatilis]|uniref:Uncharacterized protein n=1 Tax=Brachionus plicatilis TaxID=10195 RepID=A0A3M7Q1B5_BRAPC|nr:hypothetical protein BpHYR1_016746 [Brachionus plicatilis]
MKTTNTEPMFKPRQQFQLGNNCGVDGQPGAITSVPDQKKDDPEQYVILRIQVRGEEGKELVIKRIMDDKSRACLLISLERRGFASLQIKQKNKLRTQLNVCVCTSLNIFVAKV